jgi:hypothetical protein
VPVAGSKREIRVSVPAVWLSNGYQFSPAATVRPPIASMMVPAAALVSAFCSGPPSMISAILIPAPS